MHHSPRRPLALILMGVTGCGKTTVGKILADVLGWEFYDADAFHPEENISKMRQGIALTDEDRLPWLKALGELVGQSVENNQSIILACSALKESYREILRDGVPEVVHFVYLQGSAELISKRLSKRSGHFMDPNLLNSQFATLEEPREALYVDITPSPEVIVETVLDQLNASVFSSKAATA